LRELPQHDLVIFCGAGLSVAPPSNAPLWRPLRESIVSAVIETVAHDGARWDAPFPERIKAFVDHPTLFQMAPEVLCQALEACLGATTLASILECIGLGCPNQNHRSVAALARRQSLKAIVTTNFDCHVETSLRDEGVRFQVIADEGDANLWLAQPSSDILPVFKVHGSLAKPSSLIATVKGAGRVLPDSKAKVLRRLLERHHVVITGYSGNDYDVFPVLLDLVQQRSHPSVVVTSLRALQWPLLELARTSAAVTTVDNLPSEELFGLLGVQSRPITEPEGFSNADAWRDRVRSVVQEIPTIELMLLLGQLSILFGDFDGAINSFLVIARDLSSDELADGRTAEKVRRRARIAVALTRAWVWRCVMGANARVPSLMVDQYTEEARSHYVELGELYTSEDEAELWWCRANASAWMFLCNGQFEDAGKLFSNSYKQAERSRGRGGSFSAVGDETAVDAYLGFGETLASLGQASYASAVFKRALDLSLEFGSLWLAARAHLALARTADGPTTAEVHLSAAKRVLGFMGLQVSNVPQLLRQG